MARILLPCLVEKAVALSPSIYERELTPALLGRALTGLRADEDVDLLEKLCGIVRRGGRFVDAKRSCLRIVFYALPAHTQFSPLFSPRNTHAGWKVNRPYNTSMRW